MQTLSGLLVAKCPAANLLGADIADRSFIDELERDGFIDGLYSTGPQ
jgi:hypothetical protein